MTEVNDTQVKIVSIDGYRFGDRLLESVLFNVTLEKNENGPGFSVARIQVDTKHATYFNRLNAAYWYQKIQDSLDQWDVLEYMDEQGQLTPKEADAWADHLHAENDTGPSQPIQVKMTTMEDVLGNLASDE